MEKDNREYIYLEKDTSEGKVLIDIKNVNGKDIIYLLSEFIDFVSKKEDMPANVFLIMIDKAIMKKRELENKRGIFDLSMTKSKKKSRELENKITHGRRLSELTIDELKELEKVTMNDHFKEDIQKEIDKRENKYFEDYMRENKEIISFGEDDEESSYKIDEECEEDPLSVDADNINRWDYDADGDKVDIEGNKFLFED